MHAGLAWWGRFVCCCAFNYIASRCEVGVHFFHCLPLITYFLDSILFFFHKIRCYPTTEKLDDRFASIVALESSIRPLVLDVVGNRLIIFSTDSHYRSFDLSVGSKPHGMRVRKFHFYTIADYPLSPCDSGMGCLGF